MKTIFVTISLSLFMLMGFVSCDNKAKPEQAQPQVPVKENQVNLTAAQISNADITIGEPVVRSMNSTIRLNGVVEVLPSNKVYVSNPFGGFVKSTKLIPGVKVTRDQLLLVMEDPQYIQLQQDYLVAKSRLNFLELDYQRQRDLNADKSISDKSFQQVGSEYTSQKVLVKSLYEKLKLININPDNLSEEKISRTVSIYSPIDGYVSEVNVSVGKYVSSTDFLVGLTDENALHASLTAFEKDLRHITPGQKLRITSPSKTDRQYTATVHTINRSLSQDRASEVHCDFDVTDKDLYPGNFISAELAIKNADVIAVPESAVITWENKRYVFTSVDDNKFEMTPVEVGMVSDGFVEIKDDIRNRKIVTKNAYSLLMKLKSSEE